jgi:GPH family glycoside/pentoside/hexuronide:cation symporter
MNELRKRTIAAYASLGAPLKGLTLTTTLYLPAFYATDGKLGLTTVGLIFLVMRCLDIVTDPILGWLSDSTESPFGRRRLWVAIGLPMLALSTWEVFRPAIPAKASSFLVWLTLFYLSWTIVAVSHTAWATDMTPDKGLLRRLIGWREWAGMLGMLAIMIGPAIEERHGVTFSARMGALGEGLASALLCAGLIVLFLVPEEPVAAGSKALSGVWKHIRDSVELRRILIADLFVGCGYGTSSALMLFIAKYRLHVADRFSTIMLVYFVGMLLSVPGWIRVADGAGTRSMYRTAIGLLTIAQLLILVVPAANPWLAGGLWLVQGVLTGAYQFGLNGIMAEAVRLEQSRNGENVSGTWFGLLATTNKVGYAVAIGTAYPLLDALGFSAERPAQGSLPLVIVYAVLPAICFAASVAAIGRASTASEPQTVSVPV